jgi:hypothetical protein
MLVNFKLDGVHGTEVILTRETGIDAYKDAVDQFWKRASATGASWVEGARSAWDHVSVFHGPKLLTVGPGKSSDWLRDPFNPARHFCRASILTGAIDSSHAERK